MTTLNGINLGTGLYKEPASINRVQSTMERARSGNILIWEQEAGPQAFDLVGSDNTGALQKSVFDQIKELAETTHASYELVHNNETIDVVFRNWEGGVVEGEPLVPRENLTDTDYYNNIRIKLHEAKRR